MYTHQRFTTPWVAPQRRINDFLPVRWLMRMIDMLLMLVILGILWAIGLLKPKQSGDTYTTLRR